MNSDAAFGTVFRVSKYFQRSKLKLHFFVPLTREGKNLKTKRECTGSTELVL